MLWVKARHGKSPACQGGGHRNCDSGDVFMLSRDLTRLRDERVM